MGRKQMRYGPLRKNLLRLYNKKELIYQYLMLELLMEKRLVEELFNNNDQSSFSTIILFAFDAK